MHGHKISAGFGTLQNDFTIDPVNMMIHAGDSPGPEVDLIEEAAAKYPCNRSCLPENRLEDGTLWN